MAKKNMKCPKCGYRFQGDDNLTEGVCPLCSEKYSTEKAIEYYTLSYGNENDDNSNQKPMAKMIRDWIIFGVSFALFIVILYYLISFIANA
jgi:hypothetical protein